MPIESPTLWNFTEHICFHEFHFLLHWLSVGEKDSVMSAIWKQHTDEMHLLKKNLLNVNEVQCVAEFHPNADQSWISLVNNELSQAGTYPSPYSNVHNET